MNVSSIAIVVAALIGGAVIGFGAGNMSSDNKMESNDSQNQMMASNADSDGVTVGGEKMLRTLDIVDNAAKADNVTTVVKLVQQAGLVDTLKSEGPFTVFGPNNAAFDAVPEATLNKVAGNSELLTTVLTYHVVAGTYTTADLRALANSGGTLKTVQGGSLMFKVVNNQVMIMDAAGQSVAIETADVVSSNGVTHVIKNVLLPVDPSTL